MKRRVLSLTITLALCLNLCPVWVLAADEGDGLCPHHTAHTDGCGYVSPSLGQECTHNHNDSCYTTETACSHEHDGTCGYVPENPGAPCTFVCRICPIEDLIGKLPRSVSEQNSERVQAQLSEIYALYDELTSDEQQQVDLSPCAALLYQIDGMETNVLSDTSGSSSLPPEKWVLDGNKNFEDPYDVSTPYVIDTNGHTLCGAGSSVIRVTGTGVLELKGKIVSYNSAGVEVQAGGFLDITEADTNIQCLTYALDIASGANVQLSAGTYFGKTAAIYQEDNDFAALLAPGCAYFDGNGNPIRLTNVAVAKEVVVKQCTGHSKTYTRNADSPTHTWTCPYCETSGAEKCTFTSYNSTGTSTCDLCGNEITVAVTRDSLKELAYDDTVRPKNGAVTVKVKDAAAALVENTDYTVSYSTRAAVGSTDITVTVKVEGIAYNGTFEQEYTFTAADLTTPVLQWDNTSVSVDYTGSEVTKDKLPNVTINITTSSGVDLHDQLQYSYRIQGSGSAYTDGLPTNAGTYDVVVTLPEGPDYQAASSAPITLVINKINPIATPPAAANLTFNGAAQELAVAGTLEPAAAGDGAVILYATSETGEYSTSIPTGTNAGSYTVYYKVDGTTNYAGVTGAPISVTIKPKPVSPKIELSQTSYPYDGSKKEPKITVKDGDTVIGEDQYTVTWMGNPSPADDNDMLRVVGTYTATIENVDSGNNYTFSETVTVEIAPATQTSLTITGKPEHVYYGDTFMLNTTGGSGNGTVTWSITAGRATIIESTGEITVTDTGSVTVEAKRTVPNYGTVSGTLIFTVEPKPVTAEVTVAPKAYDGTTDIADGDITAAVKAGDLVDPGDSFALSGLKGTYVDANAGTGKAVTLDDTAATKADGSGKYTVSYPVSVTAGITPRRVTVTVELSGSDLQTDNSATPPDYSYTYDGTDKTPAVKVTGTDTSGYSAVLTASDYDVTYSNNKNVGNAAVTVKSKAGGNYTFPDTPVQFAIKEAEARLTSSPLPNDLTYTGQPLALVTAGTATGGHIEYSTDGTNYSASIPEKTSAGSYTVHYKVVGDGNHASSTEPVQIPVTIKPKPVNPAITLTLTADPMIYTGSPLKPAVTVAVEGEPLVQGTDYTVTYSGNTEPGTATVTVQSVSGINYQFYATETFTIAKAKATFYTAPEGRTDLVYNGTAQELIEEYTGISQEGIVLYSLNAQTYSAEIPTATKARTYTVFAKIQGNSTHADSDVFTISAEIAANDGSNLTVGLSDAQLNYTGSALQPTVTVSDDRGNVIPAGDYTVSYSDNINVGKATVTVTGKAPNCTAFTKTASFTIVGADQPKLSITGQPDKVFYGDTFQLGTTGGSASGTVTWTSSDTDVATVANGVVTVKKAGNTVIKASMDSGGNYTGPAEDSWTLIARPKPLGITVLAADKPYDAANNTAVLTVVVNSSDWVSSSDIGTITATGHFLNIRVGDNQTVIIDTLTLPSGLSDKYTVANPGTTTASITPVSASVTGTPTARTLTYNGSEQALIDVSGCTAAGGDLAYSLDGVSYNYIVPTGKDAGKYTFWYKALADENHKDSTPVKMEVEIAANTGKPTVKCSPASLPYDNTEKTPTVIVLDNGGREIPKEEYTVEYPDSRVAVGQYTVTVKDIPGGNYEFTDEVTGTFDIVAADQSPLSIISSTPTNVHYGDTFRLSASGGSGSGAIQWNSTDQSVATIDGNGVVKVVGTGSFTVEAYRAAAGGYNQSDTATLPFYADPKSVTPVVTADDKSFDGKTDAALHASWKAGDLVGNDADAITLTVTGQFVTPDVGTGKQVKVTSGTPSGDTGNYIITWPDSTTASIYRVNAELETRPGKPDLTYTGAAHPLLTGGTMKGDGKIGTIVYSLSEKGEYSETIPTGTNAGIYEVWYKVEDSVNYMGIPAASIEVEIKKATPEIATNPVASGTAGQKLSEIALNGGAADGVSGSISGIFDWVNGDIEATDGTPYNVIFTPDDTVNYNTKTFIVTVTVTAPAGGSGGGTDDTSNNSGSASTNNTGGGSGTNSTSSVNTASTRTTVRNGTASTVLSASDGSKLVRQAAASQSQSIVIKPEITGSVTKTQVSIPASTVSQIRSETNAALTVSAPIADVTIPNAALDTLSSAGGAVNVMTEQADQSVVLTLTAGGENVENVPVTLSVPAEDAGPGTVAVLVHEDGTRETIRKSVVEDGKVNIPLSGSATVEIVDNSKEFTDVPSTSWAADAVAFASAHELFSGTSETTFSPDQAMSRGMLATVLYSLEGRPDQDADLKFSDVGSDTWYADGIAWATENGIASGYGNGQFGPDDSITREQFAVMLWKYAGSPKASGQTLDFTDADQASSYAREALCWATENGILNGYTDGQLAPGKTATRAQAAQMLKNFMENA